MSKEEREMEETINYNYEGKFSTVAGEYAKFRKGFREGTPVEYQGKMYNVVNIDADFTSLLHIKLTVTLSPVK